MFLLCFTDCEPFNKCIFLNKNIIYIDLLVHFKILNTFRRAVIM